MGRILGTLSGFEISLAQEPKRAILALESEFEQMESQITALKAENMKLQAQVNPLQKQVDRLNQRIKEFEGKKTKQTNLLDEKAEKLLLAIARKLYFAKGAQSDFIDKNAVLTEYYFGVLVDRAFIKSTFSYTDTSRWIATQKGLEYLHKTGRL